MVREFRSARQEVVYSAKRSSQLRAAALLIAGGLLGLIPLSAMSRWLHGGPVPEPRAFLVLFCLLLLLLGILVIVNAIRGLPRLTVDPQGVTLQNAHTTKWAHWDSLDPFVVRITVAGRSKRQVKTASARITGANASTSRWRTKLISFTNCFDRPIEEIVAELNAIRARSLGLSETATSPVAMPEPAPVGLPGFRMPWLTFALLAVLIGVFVVELKFPVDLVVKHDPGLRTLIAWGALSHVAILSGGEWYRLFTAPLLHGSFAHILGNGIALLFGGWMLERLVGRLWFFAFFAVSALGGSLVSLAVGPADLVSVGASGALMGMFAGLFVCSFRLTSGQIARTRLQVNSLRILVPSLLPSFSGTTGLHIDYGAHAGGALAGAALAFALRRSWPETALIPQWRQAASAIAVIAMVLFAGSAGMVVEHYPDYNVAVIPASELPRTAEQSRDLAAPLVARYPGDPRSHLYLGSALAEAKDYAGAERELRLALAIAEAHPIVFGETQALISRGVLAGFLAEQGRQDEAKTVAWRTCQASNNDALKKFAAMLAAEHLCGSDGGGG
jgi:rhomboid protease GluP